MTKNNKNMNELHNWLFHYNPYTESWNVFKREHATEYFNGEYKNVIKSKAQKSLEGLIVSHGGDIKKINKFVESCK